MQNGLLRIYLIRGLVVLLAVWAAGLAVFIASTLLLSSPQANNTAGAAVVLTGGYNRVNTGLELLEKGKADYLFVTGVDQRVNAKQLLDLWGQPDTDTLLCCIILEHDAGNTVENARETLSWLKTQDIRSFYLVTSEYHMPRAYLEFRTRISDRDILLYPVKSRQRNIRYWGLVLGEYHKTAFAALWHLMSGLARVGTV